MNQGRYKITVRPVKAWIFKWEVAILDTEQEARILRSYESWRHIGISYAPTLPCAEVFLRVATTSKRAERKARRWVEKKCRLQRESRERAAKKYSFYMGCSS